MESAARATPTRRRLSPLGWIGIASSVAGLVVAAIGAVRGPVAFCGSGAVIVGMGVVLALLGRTDHPVLGAGQPPL